MARYIASEIKIEGSFPVKDLQEISMNLGVNRHGELSYGGLISAEEARAFIKIDANQEFVSVSLRDELEFRGFPDIIEVENNGEHYYLRVKLVTGSKFIDIYPEKRFFQGNGKKV